MEMLTTTAKRMFSYEELVASWARDHVDANAQAIQADKLTMLLLAVDLDGLLREGIVLWESITDLHESLIESISIGEIPPNLELEKRIWALYQQWLEITRNLKTVLSLFSDCDVTIEHSAEFLECLAEAESVLSGIKEPQTAIGCLC